MKISKNLIVAMENNDFSGLLDNEIKLIEEFLAKNDYKVIAWNEESNDINGRCGLTGLYDHCVEVELKKINNETLEEFCQRALDSFRSGLLKNESHINKKVIGELNEDSFKDISYFYGNGELIASNDFFSVTYGLDHNGFNYSWIIIESNEEGV